MDEMNGHEDVDRGSGRRGECGRARSRGSERNFARRLATVMAVGLAVPGAPAANEEDASLAQSVREAMEAHSVEGSEATIRVLEDLAARHPDESAPLEALVVLANREGSFAVAERALDRLIKLQPGAVSLRQERGVARFFQADIDGSIEDFEAYLEARPNQRPYHWQLGLALYYAGRFEDGVRLFELHRTVNPDDVENAIWHFLCKARAESVEAAREALFPFTRDARVPMKEVHDLFAGRGSREAVLAAAGDGDASPDDAVTRNHLCYAHLYLALYEEITGDAEASLRDARLAARDHAMPHYMGRVADVHFRLRSRTVPEEDGDGDMPRAPDSAEPAPGE